MKIFIRKEIIENEYRAPLVPKDIPFLLRLGFEVFVQSSIDRYFSDFEYISYGAKIVNDDWYNYNDALIIGIKELNYLNKLNNHKHVYFSHSYKNQINSNLILSNFKKSNSILYDLEYFVDSNNERLLAFGYFAGIVGVCLGLQQYALKKNNNSISNLKYWMNSNELISYTKKIINDDKPTIALIGPNGRTGQGVKYVLNQLNIPFITFSKNDNKNNLQDYDILLNCILLQSNIGTWFDLSTEFKKNIVIVDISCDYNNINNPIKIYKTGTTWKNPIFKYNKYVDIIAIDNLPSLIPYDSSIHFSKKLVELLLQYDNDENKYWNSNYLFFKTKTKDY